eukprot:3236719-Rhodomonas_salina.1
MEGPGAGGSEATAADRQVHAEGGREAGRQGGRGAIERKRGTQRGREEGGSKKERKRGERECESAECMVWEVQAIDVRSPALVRRAKLSAMRGACLRERQGG